jgi:hypothetical protein
MTKENFPELSKINTNQIKWPKGQFEISSGLTHDDVTVTIRGAIKKVGYEDNEDGTFDRVHSFIPKFVEITKENGQTVKSVDKRRQSQLLRGQIEYVRREFKPTDDEQEFYEAAMRAVRHELPDILKRQGII